MTKITSLALPTLIPAKYYETNPDKTGKQKDLTISLTDAEIRTGLVYVYNGRGK